jgi:hypothetical protein
MSAFLLVGFLVGITIIVTILKCQSKLRQRQHELDDAILKLGVRAYVLEKLLRLMIFIKPEAMLKETDTPEIRMLKQAYLDELKVVKASSGKIAIVVLVGFLLIILTAIIESIFKGKP